MSLDPDLGCDLELRATNGTFQSPNFPDNYTNLLECVYVIRSGENTSLTFDFFQTEVKDDVVRVSSFGIHVL